MEASRSGNSFFMVTRFRCFMALTAAGTLIAGCSGVIGGSSTGEGSNPNGPGSTPGGNMGGATVGKSGVTLTCSSPAANVSATPMRRLTRQEYAATVRDLLGLATVATDQIPTDEKDGPFYSNSVSTITDLWTEQYMDSAETVAQAAVAKVDTLIACNRTSMGDAPCAAQFIDRFGLKAYRRPLTTDEKTRYTGLYSTYAASDGFAVGIRMVIQTMLQSPHFLYHVEFDSPAPSTPSEVLALGPYEIAARLSFFAWGSLPDDALLAEAAGGGLADAAAVQKQAERLLADPRAKTTVGAFHMQWLGMDADDVTKDATRFPSFTPALSQAMRDETTAFTDYVFRQGDGKLETLLTAPFSILSAGPLFDLYGAKQPAAGAAGPTQLDPTQRSGILTQANFLTAHAHPNQTSPVSRGVVIRRNVLCQGLPDPPPNVNNAAPDPSPTATTRERFKAHETSPSCGGCHKLIDGIGFGFENYDAIGGFRTTENNLPIDATGQIDQTVDIDGPFNGAIELTKKLSTSNEVRECMAKQWFRFALGRTEGENDSCSVKAAYDAFAGSEFDVRKLLAAIVTTDAFRYRRPGVQ